MPSTLTFLVCRHTLLRTGLALILGGTRFRLADDVIAVPSDFPAAAHAEAALILVCETQPGEVSPGLVAELRSRCPAGRVVVMADHLDPLVLDALFRAGVDGLCPTTMARDPLVKALELVMLGERFLPGALSLELFRLCGQKAIMVPGKAAISPRGPQGRLSERETQILRCLARGASNKMIARELGLSEATIKVHIKGILRKAEATNRTQAAMWARQHQIFAADPPLAEAP